jgi:hypothetical protein
VMTPGGTPRSILLTVGFFRATIIMVFIDTNKYIKILFSVA